ncbi:type IV secretory system conjugative DNA transfer family protein [Hyphomicrobium sp. DY-1]|uniref:type IV secretory system conjugative DNA transfer family protein n=1 Tax=Hyphomicrobium sp. DY-1 TaxID=3075650 RepID=UPI0039C09EB6
MPPRTTRPPHGILLGWQDPPGRGRKSEFPSAIWDDSREGHHITIAPTGAGKGVSCIIPALLTWRGPTIIIDPKGENYAVTAARRRAMGQKVHVLDPFGLTDCLQRASLNPFDMLGPLKKATIDDMRVLANAAIQQHAFGKHQDPYWDNRAATLITEAIGYCATNLPAPTLTDVNTVVRTYDEHTGMTEYVSAKGSCHPDIGHVFSPPGMAMGRTRSSITSTAMDHLAFITDGAVAGSLWRSTIDLKKVVRGDPMTIYIVIPPNKLVTHSKLLRLWLVTLLTAISRRHAAPKIPTLFLIDEAAQLGELKELVSAVTLMRGYGMKVWSFWQDLSQLTKLYPHAWETILNNSSIHQYFGATTPMAAKKLQDYLTDTCPRPISNLAPNQTALYRPHQPGAVVRLPNYLTDPMFQGLYDPNPFYPRHAELTLVDDEFDYDVQETDSGTVLHFPPREERDA